jgi:hypothetical protein
MRAGRSFLELQQDYRDGKRVFPIDVAQNSFHAAATNGGLTFATHAQPTIPRIEWTGAFPQFSTSTGFDQVRSLPRTFYGTRGCKGFGSWLGQRRPVRASTAFVVLVTTDALGYGVHIRKPAELFYSVDLELTSNAKTTQNESFPWSLVISSVLGAKITTIPAHSMLHSIRFVQRTDVFCSSK